MASEIRDDLARISELLERQNLLLERQLANEANWKQKLLYGMLAGLGSFIGATLVVSVALYLLQPFMDLKPTFDQFTHGQRGK